MKIRSDDGIIALVTCTRDRPAAFSFCERWMARQTFPWDVWWIVVDDGEMAADTTMGQMHLRRPSSNKPHTLVDNLEAALGVIPDDGPKRLLFIEDDDWYDPTYVEDMYKRLLQAPLVGQRFVRYYHLLAQSWSIEPNPEHSSLAATGITRELFPRLRQALAYCRTVDCPLVDTRLWGVWDGIGPYRGQKDLFETPALSVGMKGLPKGRPGATTGHEALHYQNRDPHLAKLREWVGDDWVYYAELLR